jgi:hypothetical protein
LAEPPGEAAESSAEREPADPVCDGSGVVTSPKAIAS